MSPDTGLEWLIEPAGTLLGYEGSVLAGEQASDHCF
jgi:hypothetical protein